MEPISILALFALVGALLDRSDGAEAKRRALLGERTVLPSDEDKLLFDLFVQLYRETGELDTDRMYAIARENRMPGEMVSKTGAVVRSAIRDGRLGRREFRGAPDHPRIYWTKTTSPGMVDPVTGEPRDIQFARLVYADLLDLRQEENGIGRYLALRDYLDQGAAALCQQYDEDTGEYWAWLPAPSSPCFPTSLRNWNTIVRKWSDMVEPEVAGDAELRRRRR